MQLKFDSKVFKFALVGLIGLFVNELFLYLFTNEFGIIYIYSAFFSYQISLLSNFTLHSKWTFRKRNLPLQLKRFCKYELGMVLVMIVTFATLISLVEIFKLNYLLSNAIGIFIGFLIHYTMGNSYVWKASEVIDV